MNDKAAHTPAYKESRGFRIPSTFVNATWPISRGISVAAISKLLHSAGYTLPKWTSRGWPRGWCARSLRPPAVGRVVLG